MAEDKERGPRDIKERTFSFALEIVRLAQRLDKRSGVPRVLVGRTVGRTGTFVQKLLGGEE
jgi:hypothetical protein